MAQKFNFDPGERVYVINPSRRHPARLIDAVILSIYKDTANLYSVDMENFNHLLPGDSISYRSGKGTSLRISMDDNRMLIEASYELLVPYGPSSKILFGS